ncbi:hypothetical protein [Kitasatospora sp. NPDC002965]|uniref:hypothetical protein n=1 Tax=Kitasatospora sp. NPDC002965 TaxID=3154775 RepID=UPI0033B1DC72
MVVADDLDLTQDAADAGDKEAAGAASQVVDILRMGRAVNMPGRFGASRHRGAVVPLFIDTFTPVVLEPVAQNTAGTWLSPAPQRRSPIIYTGPGSRARRPASPRPGRARTEQNGVVRDVQERHVGPDQARATAEEPELWT